MSSENHVLSLLIQLRDQASAGLQKFTKNLEHSHQAAYRNASALGSLSAIGYRAIETGRMIGESWRRQKESLEKYTDAALELVRAQSKFQAINLSSEENTRAFTAVEQTVKNLRGLSLAETTDTITDLHTALGKLDEAIVALPIASKYRFSFESLFSDKFSKEEVESQIQSGFKFLEMIGAIRASGGLDAMGKRIFLPQDHTHMEEYFNRVAQMTAASGGRVNPGELLQAAKTGGTALQGLSLEGLTHLYGTVQELGGARTGTALQTLFQQVIAGRIQQHGLPEWQRLGLLDMKKVELNKSGIIKRMDAGAVPIGDYLQEDPLKFADALRDAMQKHGINTSDPKAVIRELGVLKMPRNAMEITSLFINQRDRMIKESGLASNAKNIEQLNKEAEDSPMGKLKKYESAMTDFRAKVGLPLLELSTGLMTRFMPVLDFLAEHSTLALTVLGIGKGLSFMAEASFALRASGLTGFFGKVSTEAAGAERSIGGLGAQAAGLRGKLSRLSSSPFVVTLKFIALGFAIEKLFTMMEEADERRKQFEEDTKVSGMNYDQWVSSGHAYTSKTTPDEKNALVNQALENFNKSDMLKQALAPETRKYGEYAWTAQRSYASRWSFGLPQYLGLNSVGADFRPDIAAQIWPKVAPQLNDPRVLAGLIAKERRGEIDYLKVPATEKVAKQAFGQPNRQELFEQALRESFPQSFPAAVKLAEEEMEKSSKSSADLTISLTDLLNPTSRLIPTFSQLGDSATRLGLRLENIGPAGTFFGNYQGGPKFGFSGQPEPQGPIPVRPPFTFGGVKVPSRAIGGIVERDGMAMVHAGNVITPARVTKGLSGAHVPAIHLHNYYSPTINGTNLDEDKLLSVLSRHSRHLADMIATEVAEQIARA